VTCAQSPSRALRVELAALTKVATPAILHWGLNHYVVLKEAKAKKLVGADKNSYIKDCLAGH